MTFIQTSVASRLGRPHWSEWHGTAQEALCDVIERRVPLTETIEAMQAVKDAGKIRHWGVSNLDTDDMEELADAGGASCVTDQVLYNLTRRGPELDLLPWLADHGMWQWHTARSSRVD